MEKEQPTGWPWEVEPVRSSQRGQTARVTAYLEGQSNSEGERTKVISPVEQTGQS